MRKARVLLVDDEMAFTSNVTKILSRRGYEVVAAHDGLGALRALEAHDFDVVILDLKMPGMDGIATLKEIKRLKPLVEVIILTGHGSVDSGIQGMHLGAFDYAMKPIHPTELHEKICLAYQRKLIQEERETSGG